MAVFDKQDKAYIITITLLVGVILFFYFKTKSKEKFINTQYEYIQKLETEIDYYRNLDSTYVVKRDSIEYNIIKRDSIIYKIKEEYAKQKDSVLISSDGVVVDKFNELVWAD